MAAPENRTKVTIFTAAYRNQVPSQDQHIAFARRFGPIDCST